QSLATNVIDHETLMAQMLPGDGSIFGQAGADGEARDVFSVYKQYMLHEYNYNTQTWAKREAFNQRIYMRAQLLNTVYLAAVG
ncbi:hypothetical protein, partial [Eubacterium aggregans]|uniref:hypothetical protein n=1 Tax=Eubacterium aggregans TaxID=81409 RepID=UPI003F2B1AFE